MKNILLLLSMISSTQVFAGEIEEIIGYTVDMQGITYQVTSGGCTKKQDFQVQQLETFPIQMRLVRNRFDGCEAFVPYGVTVKFTWKELGISNGAEFVVENPRSVIRVH